MLFTQDYDIPKDSGKEAFGAVVLARWDRFQPSDDLTPRNYAGLHTGPAKVDSDCDLRAHQHAGFPTLRFAIIRKPSSVRFG